MKKCNTCSRHLNKENFYNDKYKKDGKHTKCIDCCKIASHNYRKNYPEKQKSIEMRIRYGITLDQYNLLLKKQGEVWKICKQKCKSGFNLAVDHCHLTKIVRGLLCTKCNRGIGMFNDDPDLLLSAINYLQEVRR